MKKKFLIFMLKYLLFLALVTGIGAFAYFMGYGQDASTSDEPLEQKNRESQYQNSTKNEYEALQSELIDSVEEKTNDIENRDLQEKQPPSAEHDNNSNDRVDHKEEAAIQVSFDRASYDIDDDTYLLYLEKLVEAGPVTGDIDFVGTYCDFERAGIRLEGIIRNGSENEFVNEHIQINVYAKDSTGEEFLLADNEFLLHDEAFGRLESGGARFQSFRFGPNRVSNKTPDWSKGYRVEISFLD